MTKITLGKTGITTDRNAFGALPIQRIPKEEAARLLRRAYDGGFTFFDTARAYTDSEEKLGYALSDVRSHITIATKTAASTAEFINFTIRLSVRNQVMKADSTMLRKKPKNRARYVLSLLPTIVWL